MKTCTKCGLEKDESEFYFNKHKGRLDSHCKDCQRQYRKRHYDKNRQYYKDKARRNAAPIIKSNKVRLKDYLESNPCVDCGEGNWIVLEFDHLPEFDKERNVSALALGGWRWETVKAEIDKCEVVCANCHRIRTYARAESWRAE